MANQPFKVPDRVTMFTRDVQNITGVKERTARQLLQRIREANNKRIGEYVTIVEFCEYTGIDESLVRDFLKL